RRRAAVRGSRGASPEHVSGVRDDVRDEALVAVQRLRIEGAARHPEGALEFLAYGLGASREPGGPSGIALRDDLGERSHRGDRVRLHLDRGDRAFWPFALRVEIAVAGI